MTELGGRERTETLKQYTDEGFGALRRSLDQFRSEFHDYISALHAEIDRRFLEAREEVSTARLAQQRAIDAALISAEKAVDRANEAADKRFEGVNEFRGQLTDQAATFISRNEYSAAHQALADKLDAIDKRLTTEQGSAAGARQLVDTQGAKLNNRLVMLGVLVSAVVVIVNVIIYYVTHK